MIDFLAILVILMLAGVITFSITFNNILVLAICILAIAALGLISDVREYLESKYDEVVNYD